MAVKKDKGVKGTELCRTLDIQPYVLRYWETEFKALQAAPGMPGQRVYSDTDVALVRRIKQLLYEEGYTIAGAKKKLESEPVEATAAAVTAAHPPEVATLFENDGEPDAPAPPPPAKTRAATEAAPAPSASLDSGSEERIEQLELGISEALSEARSVLRILDKHPR